MTDFPVHVGCSANIADFNFASLKTSVHIVKLWGFILMQVAMWLISLTKS
jgi:hypothetical protein